MEGFGVLTKTARFTETIVSFVQKSSLASQLRLITKENTAILTVILTIQRLDEYLEQGYRVLKAVLKEMPRVTRMLGLTAETRPHFSTVCVRKQEIPIKHRGLILDSSVELYDFGDVQVNDPAGVNRSQASQHYANRRITHLR